MTPEKTHKKTVRTVSRRACLSCREKKIKCDGVHVCSNCEQMNLECVFVKSHRGGRRTISKNNVHHPSSVPSIPPPSSISIITTTTTPSSSSASTSNPASSLSYTQPPPRGGVVLPVTSLPLAAGTAPVSTAPPHPHSHAITPPVYSARPTLPMPRLPSFESSSEDSNSLRGKRKYSLPSIASLDGNIANSTSNTRNLEQPSDIHSVTNGMVAPNGSRSAPISSGGDAGAPEDSIVDRISHLQLQINQIRSRLPTSIPMLNVGVPNWQVSEQDLTRMDLPNSELATFMVDLYYQNFHKNHPFLYPRSAFFRYLKLSTQVALVHAMFSISCRFLPAQHQTGLHSYMRDPQFWIANAKKYLDTLASIDHAKTFLIIGLGLQASGEFDLGSQYTIQCNQIIELHQLDKHHITQAGLDRDAESHALTIATNAQLLERESMVRTLWASWKSKVQIGVWKGVVDELPHFNSNLCLPVPNELYERELAYWDRKRLFWSDFETELLAFTSASSPSSSTPFSSSSGEPQQNSTGKYRTFYDTTFMIASTQLMATATRLLETNQMGSPAPEPHTSLDARIRTMDMVLSQQPPVNIMNAAAHMLVYSTAMMMHSPVCFKACVFIPTFKSMHSHTEPGDMGYLERPVDAAYQELQADRTAQQSYMLCSWAAQGLCRLLIPPEEVGTGGGATGIFNKEEAVTRYWLQLHEFMGNAIELNIVFLCTELLYARHSKSTPVKPRDASALSQDLQVCLAFLEKAAIVWGNVMPSWRRAKMVYDKVMNQLQ